MAAQTFDAIVLGLGGMGSAAAYHLVARGKRVLGLEQYSPAHDRGSSHGESRIIRQAYHEHPSYVPLVIRAYELWEDLEQKSGKKLMRLTGGLTIGTPGSALVDGALASAAQHKLPCQKLDARELKRLFPVLNPRPDETAVYEERAGFLRPEACVEAHLEQAARHGAELHFEEKVQRWEAHPSGSGVQVTTDRATYEAAGAVLSPGAWASQLLSELRVLFDIRRHVMCWFRPLSDTDSFLPERFPVYIWDVDGTDIFYGFPAVDGIEQGIKLAMHSGGERCTPETIERHVSDDDVAELRAKLKRFIPPLNGPLIKAVTCMYTLTPDEHFVLSLHPDHPQVAIAAGFSGHGFKFTSVIGEILADLAINRATRHGIDLFDPRRFEG